jgi:hypothetical protein
MKSFLRIDKFSTNPMLSKVRIEQMRNDLSEVLSQIGNDFKGNILDDSRNYREVSIAQKADELGFAEIKECYKDAYAIIPLKRPLNGMKVRIDGRTFVNYSQFDSGVVVPQYVARQVDMPKKSYIPQDSMICNY